MLLILLIIDSIKNRKFTKLGYLFYPLVALNIASIITIFNAPDTFSWFAGFVQTLITLVLYVYFVNTLDKKEDNIANIGKILMYAGMVVTFEMLHFLHVSEKEVLLNIMRRYINLGWENLNVIIYSNILAIPFIGYLVIKSKIKIPYMIFAVVNILGIMLTLSRSSLLTLAIVVTLMIPVILVKESNKKSLIIQGVIFLTILFVVGYYLEERTYVTGYLDSLFGRDIFKFSDREALLIRAWEMFKAHPIIGSGGLYTSRIYLEEFNAKNYHNTIAQVSTLGIIGLGTFVYLFVEKTRLIINKKTDAKWFILIMIYATAFINGSLQPMYFYTSYLIFIFMTLAAIEKSDDSLDEGK